MTDVHRGCIASLAIAVGLFGQTVDRPDLDAIYKIKAEGFQHSKVMEVESYLTDVYGPRLTGSPNFKLAAEYVRKQLKEFGLVNVHFEKYPFGRGWANERFYVHAISPQAYPIIGYVKAWTPGTQGLVSGEAVDVTSIRSEADFAKFTGKLTGKFVLADPPYQIKQPFEAQAHRLTDAELTDMAKQPDPSRGRIRGPVPADPDLPRKKTQFFLKEGVFAMLETAPNFPPLPSAFYWIPQSDYGTVSGGTAGGSRDPKAPPVPTMLLLAPEHYNRMMRTIAKKIPVTLEMNIQNKFFDSDSQAFNVLGEIPGTDKADEVVMLGAHLDSWHMGTGATDNGSGAATMIEAVRILKATGLKLRRTVRVGLWSGEEQGIMGSRAYVTEHFYDRAAGTVKPEHAKLSAYFNLDGGAGAIRGIALQGNEAMAPICEAWIQPFRNLGATTVAIRNIVSSDHMSFDSAGLPGFQFLQDPLDYSTRTHHTNMDVYDRVQSSDMLVNAVIIASFVYHAANRELLLPRKPMMMMAMAQAQPAPQTPAPALSMADAHGPKAEAYQSFRMATADALAAFDTDKPKALAMTAKSQEGWEKEYRPTASAEMVRRVEDAFVALKKSVKGSAKVDFHIPRQVIDKSMLDQALPEVEKALRAKKSEDAMNWIQVWVTKFEWDKKPGEALAVVKTAAAEPSAANIRAAGLALRKHLAGESIGEVSEAPENIEKKNPDRAQVVTTEGRTYFLGLQDDFNRRVSKAEGDKILNLFDDVRAASKAGDAARAKQGFEQIQSALTKYQAMLK